MGAAGGRITEARSTPGRRRRGRRGGGRPRPAAGAGARGGENSSRRAGVRLGEASVPGSGPRRALRRMPRRPAAGEGRRRRDRGREGSRRLGLVGEATTRSRRCFRVYGVGLNTSLTFLLYNKCHLDQASWARQGSGPNSKASVLFGFPALHTSPWTSTFAFPCNFPRACLSCTRL